MKRSNKLFMKKLCSLCVALVMVLSMAGSPVVTAYATEAGDDLMMLDTANDQGSEAEKATPNDAKIIPDTPLNGVPTDIEIDKVDVNIRIPLVGESNPSVDVTCNTEGCEISVNSLTGWTDAGGGVLVSEEDCNSDAIIKLRFAVTPKEGYTLTPTTIVTVNGSTENVYLIGGSKSPASSVEYKCFPQLVGTIDVIELTDVPTPEVGQKAIPYSVTGTNYSVTGTWMVYDREIKDYKAVDAAHTFANGNIYKLQLFIKADVGYEFLDNVKINTIIDYDNYMSSFNEVQLGFITSFATVIDEVSISEDSIPKAEVGKTFEHKVIEIPVPEGSNYTVVGYWTDEDWNRSGTFENGKAYEFNVEIYPNSGYCLSEYLVLYIGEKPYPIGLTPNIALHTDRQSFATVIDKVYVSNLPVAAVGETIKKGEQGHDFPVEVPADANYTAYAWWSLSDGEEMTEDTFQSGKSYDLYVRFEPKDGYEFSDSLIVNADGIDYGRNGADKRWAMYVKAYSFRKVIDKLQVDGVKKPVVGETPSVDTLKVPDGANYVIASAEWIDYNTGELATTFENGHEYCLDLCFKPKDGCEFEFYADIIVDGENYSELGLVMPDEAYVSCAYTSFETLISEIRVDNMPEMKVGETATLAATVPDGVNYGIGYMAWRVWDDKLNSYKEFTGIFEAGKLYELHIEVYPNPGYAFDKDATVIYINGALDESVTAYSDALTITKEYTNGLKVIDRVEFTIAEPVVGNHSSILPQVMVSADANYYVDERRGLDWLFEKNGRHNSFYGYFDENTSYGVEFGAIPAEGYVFAEELVVIVNGVAVPQDDIMIRGKWLYVDYFFDAECEHMYGDWTDGEDGAHAKTCTICGHKVTEEHTYEEATGKCTVCGANKPAENQTNGGADGAKPGTSGEDASDGGAEGAKDTKPGVAGDGTPATGDSFAMTYMLAIMAMCGVGIYALERKRRKADCEE